MCVDTCPSEQKNCARANDDDEDGVGCAGGEPVQSVAQRCRSVVRRGDAVERFAERCSMYEQWYSGWCGVPDGVVRVCVGCEGVCGVVWVMLGSTERTGKGQGR